MPRCRKQVGCAWRVVSSRTVGRCARAAERFQVSATTAARWADRYRALGAAGMGRSLSSRPHHSPRHNAHAEAAAHRSQGSGAYAVGGRRAFGYLLGLPPFHRAPGADPLRRSQVALVGPPHRPCHPPHGTGPLRRHGAYRCQEARQDPRRRGLADGRTRNRSPQSTGTRRRSGQLPTATPSAAITSFTLQSTVTQGWRTASCSGRREYDAAPVLEACQRLVQPLRDQSSKSVD